VSLVSTYVYIGDGEFLANPTIRFPEGFICFDDDDPPEIVLRKATTTCADGKKILVRLGIPHEDLEPQRSQGERMFGRDVKSFAPARTYFFTLTGPLPRGLDVEHDGVVKHGALPGDCCIEGLTTVERKRLRSVRAS
jgi:hypothetical protein